jgi:hypothetical protein
MHPQSSCALGSVAKPDDAVLAIHASELAALFRDDILKPKSSSFLSAGISGLGSASETWKK